MPVYKVGEPFVHGRTSLQHRAEYNFRFGQHGLLLCLRRLREEEVRAVRVGQAEFGLMLYGDVIFLLYRFGDGNLCGDAPYSWHLVPPDQQQLPEPPATAERQAVLQVILVDADRNVVRALRAVTLSPDFTHTLHEAIRRQAGQPWDPAAYDKQLERAYQQHPTTADMLAACAVGCRGGD